MFRPTLEVLVACPEIFNPRRVVVPKPVPEISRAEMEEEAKVEAEDVER